jgi:hypothetical protein
MREISGKKIHEQTHAPHYHNWTWIGPCIIQRSTQLLQAAYNTGKSRRCSVFLSDNPHSTTKRSLQSWLDRWNRRHGNFDRVHYRSSHPAAKKILDAASVIHTAAPPWRGRRAALVKFPSNDLLLKSVRQAGDENRT